MPGTGSTVISGTDVTGASTGLWAINTKYVLSVQRRREGGKRYDSRLQRAPSSWGDHAWAAQVKDAAQFHRVEKHGLGGVEHGQSSVFHSTVQNVSQQLLECFLQGHRSLK